MAIKLKTTDGLGGSAWKDVSQIKLKVSGAWKNVAAGYLKVAGAWKIFFGTDTINAPSIAQKVALSQSTNSGLITLTGTNYYWTNASSLVYVFERSANGGSSWTPISSGTVTNPSSGSSNTKTYQLQDNKSDVYPNVDNLYRFTVTATSAGGSTTASTSDNQSVSAARDISNLSVVTADTTYDSVKLQFTAGAYSSSYFVRYTYSDGTAPGGTAEGYFRSAGSGSPTTTVTVTGLSASKTYTFYVTPYTGGIASGSNTGYGGNESSSVSETTSAVLTPVQTSSPSLSGTGAAFTSITAASGAYQIGTYQSITTKIVYYLSPYTAPTDGEVSSSATIMDTATPVPTHPIGQDDATTPNKKFYARDAVTSSNGATTYYYYSNLVSAFIPAITDTFNRSVSPGLGTTSSGYVYSSVVEQERSTWSTNGSTASSNGTILRYVSPIDPGSFAASYPLQAIELTGKTNLTASVEIPSGGGGPGIAFWVSGAGSFWAIAPAYSHTSSTSQVTSTNCNGSVISTNSNGTNPNCYNCPVTTSTSGGTSSDCNASAFSTNSNGTSPNCYGCPVTTIPATTSSDCNFPVDKATDAQGTGCFGCTVTSSGGGTSYSCGSGTVYNYSSSFIASMNCRGCTVTDTSYVTQTCPTPTTSSPTYANNTLGTACGDKCSCIGPYTSTTYGCTGSATYAGTLANCNNLPNFAATAANVDKKCSSCTQAPVSGAPVLYATVKATNTTYYHCTTRVCSTTTQFSCTYATVVAPTTYTCRGRDTSTPISYTCKGRDTSTPVVTSYSCTGQQVTNNVTTNTYKTNLRIMSTVGSYVQVLKDQNINTNTSAFNKAFKISVTTSGDTITGTAFSDLSGTSIGTATYTRASGDLAKTSANGSSYAGVVKTPSAIDSSSIDNNPGSTYDNLSIS
jgi:hypothetical protein